MSISREEWLTALNEAGFKDDEHDPESITVPEFAALMGMTRITAERRLKALVTVGKAKKAYKRVVRANGAPQTLPSYRLVKPEPKRKREAL